MCVCVCVCVCVCACVCVYAPHPLASSTTPHHPTLPLPKNGWTPLHIAARLGSTDAVKELVAAGCDINLANKVKQMTRLALALACLCFRTRGRLAALAQTHAGGDASSISACSACVCLSSLTNICMLLLCNCNISRRKPNFELQVLKYVR